MHSKLFFKNATCHFVFIGAASYNDVNPERQGQILERAARLVEEGKLSAHVSRVLKLDELVEGHKLQESGKVTGKLAVKVR